MQLPEDTGYNRILVPLDGSVLAEQVLSYVRLLAEKLSIPVHLLRVVDNGPPELADPRFTPSLQRQGLLTRQAEEYLKQVGASLGEAGVETTAAVQLGNPAEVIVGEAEQDRTTLITMSTHGWSGIVRWFLGSVADKVLHATTNPLLIVRAHPTQQSSTQPRLTSVMVPLDGSPMAEQVLPWVVQMAQALDLQVVLVRVTPSREDYHHYMEYLSTPDNNITNGVNQMTLDYLHQVGQRLRQQGVARVEEKVLHGHPAVAIVEFARAIPDNLIAMTSHGRSGVGYWLLGSVTDLVARHSGDPVLVVRARSTD